MTDPASGIINPTQSLADFLIERESVCLGHGQFALERVSTALRLGEEITIKVRHDGPYVTTASIDGDVIAETECGSLKDGLKWAFGKIEEAR